MDWKSCLITLESTKITDRIRGLKNLSTLLDSSESLDELAAAEDENVSLNHIFETMDKLLVKEATRVRTLKGRVTRSSVISNNMNAELKRAFTKLMSKAGELKNRITEQNLLASLNRIFNSFYLRKNFGAQYYLSIVPVLVKKRTYWGEISGRGWRDLIRISLLAYGEESIGLDKPKVAKNISHLISQGSLNSELTLWLSCKYACMLQMVLNANCESAHAAECNIMMALSYTTKIAKENRELACKFGENVMELVLKCYDPKASESVMLKSVILEFLIFQIKIHHLNGAVLGSVGAYADDCQKWESSLRQMFSLVREEVVEVSERIHVSTSQEPLEGRFLEFAVKVCGQIMNMPRQNFTAAREPNEDQVLDSTVPKESGLKIFFEVLKELPEERTCYWLYIISVLIKKYDCVDGSNYIGLLDSLSNYISSKREGATLNCFLRCCCSVAAVQVPSTCTALDYMSSWHKIWDMAIWAIGLSQCEAISQETLLIMLASNLHSKKRVMELFEMYLTDQMLPTEGSVRTLHFLMMSLNTGDDMDLTTRQACLNWVYPVKEKYEAFQDVQTLELVADLLVQLCLKGSIKKVPLKQTVSKSGSLEHFYSQMLFCDGLLIPHPNPSTVAPLKLPDELSPCEDCMNMLTDMVHQDGERLVCWANGLLESDVPETGLLWNGLEFMSSQLLVVVHIASNLIAWRVYSPTSEETMSILNVFKKMLEGVANLLEALSGRQCSTCEWTKIFKNLMHLYELQVDKHVATFMRENTPDKLVSVIISDLKERAVRMKDVCPRYIRTSPDKYCSDTTLSSIDYYSILDLQIFPENITLTYVQCKLFGAFCGNNGTYLPQQDYIMAFILTHFPREVKEIQFPLQLQMLMAFLFVPIKRMSLDAEYLSNILSKFENMSTLYSNDVELLQIILTVLEEVAQKGITRTSIQDMVVKSGEFYLKNLYDGIMAKKYPPALTVKIVNLLGCLIKINPNLTWPWLLNGDKEQIPIGNFLFQELDSPYLEVRMAVAEQIYSLLHPLKYACTVEQNSSVKFLVKCITTTCSGESINLEEGHRRGNIVKIAIHCLCIVAVTTPLLRKTAVYHILTLIANNQLDRGLGKRITSILGKEMQTDGKALLLDYLLDLLEKWVMLNDFKAFPYWLIYDSIEDFYTENEGVIFSNLWLVNNESLGEFCHTLGKKSFGMLKDNSAMLIAITLSQYLSRGTYEDLAIRRQRAQLVFNQLMKVHPDLNLYEVLSSTRNHILYNMFRLFHDGAKMDDITGDNILISCSHRICYPRRSAHHYTLGVMLDSFEMLRHWNKEPAGVLYMDYLLNQSPDHFRVVLLLLASDVIKAPTPCDALTAMIAFQSYVEYTMEYVEKAAQTTRQRIFMRKIRTGLIRDSCFSYLRFIRRWSNSENDTISTMGFILFRKNMMECFSTLLRGLQVVLVPTIYALVDLVQEGCVKGFDGHVLKLIESLLEMDILKEELFFLVPFPHTSPFENLNIALKKVASGGVKNSLRMDLEDFLLAYHIFGVARIEMLQHLEAMLNEKKGEIKDLYCEIEKKNDSFRRYSDSVLHRTISVLTTLCTTADHEIKTKAARCLAELGPGDIKTAVLLPETAVSSMLESRSVAKNTLSKLTLKCLELLPKYLLDPSMEVVEATSTALMGIVNSTEGELILREQWPHQLQLAEDYTMIERTLTFNIPTYPLEFSEVAFNKTVDLWVPSGDCSHSKWITSLVTGLLQCFTSVSAYFEKLIPICELKDHFCEGIFPFVLEIYLRCGEITCQDTLFGQIRHFFRVSYETFTCRTGLSPKQGDEVIRNKTSILTMLNVINYLKLQHYGMQMRCSDGDEGDALNYLHCAVAARHCSAYFSAIQYCALWVSQVSMGNEPCTLAHHVNSSTPGVAEILIVLRESYTGLGDIDGLLGCGTSHLLESMGRIEHFKQLDKWEQVLRSYELELLDTGKMSAADGLLMSLQMLGMEELLMGLLEARDQEEVQGYKYECGWRLGSWNFLSQFPEKGKHPPSLFLVDDTPRSDVLHNTEENKDMKFHKKLFLAIHSIQNGKYTEGLTQLVDARETVIQSISLASLEACENIYQPISRLHALKQVEEFASALKTSRENALTVIQDQWRHSDLIDQKSFKIIEPIKALRLTLLKYCCIEGKKAALVSATDEPLKAIAELQLQLGQSAREAGMYAISEKYLRALWRILKLWDSPSMQSRLRCEEAQLYWAKGDIEVAKVLMQSIVQHINSYTLDKPSVRYCAEALTVYGQWIMQTRSEKPKEVLAKYFGSAADLMDMHQVEKSSCEYLNAVRYMARYADEQYIITSKYISSTSYAKKQQCASHALEVVGDYEGACYITTDEKCSIRLLEKQANLDERELEQCEADKTSYLDLALSHYIKFLKYSPEVELEMAFRFVSLFLDYHSDEESIFAEIDTIPSYKFIPVIPQLLPRIVLSRGRCSRTLKSIVEKCAQQHPHHVLPYILALAYSLKDLDRAKGSDAFITETQKANERAAQKMVAKLRKIESLSEHIAQISTLWETLISLANLPVSPKETEKTMDPGVVAKLENLSQVQIPTVELNVLPIGEYWGIISIWKYMPKCTLVGGINLPKKIICIGSDGMRYPQLLKGQDDLRQDAVMQQVFQLMNSLLCQDESSRLRKLRMRTYRVVPLSHRSGIIQWCPNTISIGSYLHGGRHAAGAHSRFNPSDYPVRTCKNMMKEVQKSAKKVKMQIFREICENLRPVFRHYFFTKFPNPGLWFEMSRAYTRSVATSSIIGYVMGLGDRHLQNILLDESTAEVVHVDLGIAFEQGKTLSTPETVPFRLTRDIVDGMGISGVEGTFRRSCEVTMSLMRKNHQIILAVLEVLIYDPLYAWTLKPKYKMLEAGMEAAIDAGLLSGSTSSSTSSSFGNASNQTESYRALPSSSSVDPPVAATSSKSSDKASATASEHTSFVSTEASTQCAERNKIAVRALERLQQKLLGREDSTTPSSVEAQVERLIQEAQDPENLCVIYPGWQPYL